MSDLTRRRLLGSAGTLAAAGFAGCSTEEESVPTEDVADYDGVDAWLGSDEIGGVASNYNGVVYDYTNEDIVRITVGAEGNGGNLAFDPVAVHVSSGATVIWEWSGEGGMHNVVATEEDINTVAPNLGNYKTFDSGEPTAEDDATFQVTDDLVTSLYKCEPHLGSGMKGAVIWL